MMKESNPKDAVGATKPPLSTIPCPVLFEIGNAMLEGGCKYRRHNYRIAGVRMSIYYDAAMRHLMQWWEGQDIDPDSGIHHVSKAIAGLVIIRDAMMRNMARDDRPPSTVDTWIEDAQKDTDAVLTRHPIPLEPYVRGDEPE